MTRIIITLLTAFTLASCINENEVQTITANNYQIELPAYLNKAYSLNDDASLQYMNMWREFYVIVIDETKAEMHAAIDENQLSYVYSKDLNGYSSLLLDSFNDFKGRPNHTPLTTTTINGMQTQLTSISDYVDGIGIYYKIGYFESENNYYQVCTWTLKEYKAKYDAKMDKIIHSFKELNN